MVKVIINADDFGMNEGRTRAILEFFSQGLITNTTLMVNMPFCETAVKLAQERGLSNKVGLHLNLTEGVPLTEGIKASRLFCDEQGRFNRCFHLNTRTRLFLPSAARQVLKAEVQAQIEKFLSLGLRQRHLDSHHHAHTDYAVLSVLLPILRQRGFRSVRLSANLRAGGLSLAKRLYKGLFNRGLGRLAATDYFAGPSDASACWKTLAGKTVELMTHPVRCADGFCSVEPTDVANYETTAEELTCFLRRYENECILEGYESL